METQIQMDSQYVMKYISLRESVEYLKEYMAAGQGSIWKYIQELRMAVLLVITKR